MTIELEDFLLLAQKIGPHSWKADLRDQQLVYQMKYTTAIHIIPGALEISISLLSFGDIFKKSDDTYVGSIQMDDISYNWKESRKGSRSRQEGYPPITGLEGTELGTIDSLHGVFEYVQRAYMTARKERETELEETVKAMIS